MQKSKITLYSTLLFVLFSLGANAQKLKQFNESKEAYLADLQGLLKEIEKRKEKVDSVYTNFALTWNEPDFWNDEERKAVVLASNNLLRKRINEFQDWQAFLGIVAHLKNQEDEAYFLPWVSDFAELAKRSTKRIITDYLQIHALTFFNNDLFNDGTIRWKFDGSYEFAFAEGQSIFKLEDVTITGFYKEDSTTISGTSGSYYPKDFRFTAKGGRVYWTRNGLSADSAYADLDNYEIPTNKSSFTADSVTLFTLFYFNEPIIGKYEERMSSRAGESASFPRFTSYRKDLTLTDIVPDVDFSGGASLVGNRFFGAGSKENRATLYFKFQGEPIVKAQADQFWLRKDMFASEAAVVSVKLDTDSMFHPKSSVRYFVNRRTLSINRSDEGIARTPYSNSYHALDIFFESLTWKLDDPQFHLGNLNMGTVTPVVFESQQYFRAERFEAISGLDHVNPLYKIKAVGDAFSRRDISLEEMARSLGMSPDACHRFMMNMSIQGFVNYDLETGEIVLKDKVWDYTNNWEEKRDYDVIRFVSGLSSGANASVSLLSYDMEIRGIDRIALSDSQQVFLYPKGGKINMHKGLDFDFDGKIVAGRFSYWGNQFYFNYDQFQINMANIDSMRFKVESFTPDRMGNRPLVDVKNVLQNINGELLVDKPNNKSGKVSYTEYPIFRSGKESYVYYDRRDVFGGVYDRQRFYIELEPFEIDSLDNTSTEGLFFNGVFSSAGIFADMFQEIRVQDDYSLGFVTQTPPSGFAAYGGKGTFKNELRLDNRGLRGDGEIEYLASKAIGEKFLFFPDSVNGLMNTYNIDKKDGTTGHPHVYVTGALMHWEPLKDVMYSTNKETPFEMYDDIGMRAKGELALSPSGLNGKGRLDFLDAQTDSKDYKFRSKDFESPALDFRVRAKPDGDWAFQLANAKSEINFTKENGEFTLNDPASFFEFPINQYNAFMDFAEWLIPEKAVEVKKRGQEPSSLLLSVHPKQDSLQFIADRAKFFLEPSMLEVFEANEIDVADARIFPDTGYVVIDPAADMRVLENSIVLATRDNKYHQFLGSSIKIRGRFDYSGSGDYEYFDEDNTPWPLYFEEIKVDRRTKQTVGRANVKEEDGFFLSPFFAYYGRVDLTAPEQHLRFNGYTLIQQTCENIQTTWFKFNSVIDPMAIVIDLPSPEEAAGKRLYNGIYISNDSTSGYSAFLSQESDRAALELLTATGVLTYDKEKFSYIITTKERLENPNAVGNYLALNNKDCITTGEGLMSFGDRTGQVKLEGYGTITHDLEQDFIETDVALIFNFPFADDILKMMSDAFLNESSFAGVNIDNPAFKYALKSILTEKEMAKYKEEVALFGAPDKLPKSLRNTIVMNQLYMYWNKETNSFFSEGEIGIGSVLDVQVNKLIPGQIELQRKRRGDELFLYFEVDSRNNYYFQYRKNLMQFYSADKEAMRVLIEMDPKKRTVEGKNGEPNFIFNQTTKGR
ncbi:MAG: hypothetical protein LAT76_10875, partial [Schleiferiaceae bacterium]|nr:hypothetical protein [Schleiferiaceae bacterium]